MASCGAYMADVQRLRQQLDDFFSDLKTYGPKRGGRLDLLSPAVSDDSDEESGGGLDTLFYDPSTYSEPSEVPRVVAFERGPSEEHRPMAAVDAGLMRLGESEDGIIIALRGAILIRDGTRAVTGLVRSGPIFLSWEHEAELLLLLGQWLGDPGYYVAAERSEGGGYHAGRLKDGVGGRKYLADRFRAGLERYCQRIAAASVKGGTLLLDGSLTLRSRDTPDVYLNQIAYLAGRGGNSIIGLSKKSELVVGGRAIPYWLDDQPAVPCHRALTPILRWEDAHAPSGRGGRADRVMGNVYASRLSPLGPTYRMDVKAAPGVEDATAIHRFYGSATIYCGYPTLLARAHAACYVSAADFLALQVQATSEFGLRPQRNALPLKGAFAPFGGSYK